VEAWGDVGGLKAEMGNNGGAVFILGSAVAPVDAAGEALAYPPIHVHHFHLSNGYDDSEAHRPMIEVHGDSACSASQGGMDCLVRMLPPGMPPKLYSAFAAPDTPMIPPN